MVQELIKSNFSSLREIFKCVTALLPMAHLAVTVSPLVISTNLLVHMASCTSVPPEATPCM